MLIRMVTNQFKLFRKFMSQASSTYTQPCMILGVFYVWLDR